jgi:hypothetical protein
VFNKGFSFKEDGIGSGNSSYIYSATVAETSCKVIESHKKTV